MVLSSRPDDWYWVAISILATWRLGCLVCYDEGPFQIMLRIRKIFYQMKWNGWVECFHCVTMWISVIVVGAVFEPGIATVFIILAVAGGASLMERWLSSGST